MVANDPNKDVHGHSSLRDVPEKPRNWLPLLLGALGLLALLFFLLKGCDDDTDRAVPVDNVEATETAAAVDPVNTATTVPAYSRAEFDRTLTGTTSLPATYGLDRVTFDTGSAELGSAAAAEVADLASALKARSTARVSLRGFADPSGDAAANQALSERRVAAVRNALIEGGVAANQITADASGETGSAATRDNRRVEITLLQR